MKGRWTLHEHRNFLVGLARYGKDWKAIGGLVRTRTVVQIRTHAQKYFLKTEKGRCFPEEVRMKRKNVGGGGYIRAV